MNIGSFLAGFIIGGGILGSVGYTFARDIYLKQADEEIASVKKHAVDNINKAKKEAEEAIKALESATEATRNFEAAKKALNSYDEATIRLRAELQKTEKESSGEQHTSKTEENDDETEDDLEGLGHEFDSEEDWLAYDPAEEEFPIEGENYVTVDHTRKDPYPIYQEQYDEEMIGFYDKLTLEYYPEDDILLTEYGVLIDDREQIVGDLWLEEIRSGFKEAFVRNEQIGNDYMIVVKPGYGVDNMKGDIE